MDYFNVSFVAGSESSFQMNPLSQHPPRTPRTSTVSRYHEYDVNTHTPNEELIEQQAESVSDDDEKTYDETHHVRVRREDVWHDLLKTAYGRDKSFVCSLLRLDRCTPLC